MRFSDLSKITQGKNNYRLLLIDDDEDDYVLIQDMLRNVQEGKYQLEWASSFQAGRETITTGTFDAILINYDLGAHSGVELIHEAASGKNTAPILMLSGRGHPEVDIEAIQAGAADYLYKDELNSGFLERSIRYAIERRRLEIELDRRLQERLDILDSIQDGLFAIDGDWRIKYINQRAAQNMGLTAEELLGKNILETFPKMRGTLIEQNYRKVMEEHRPMQFEMRGLYQDRWYSISVYPAAEGISIYWQDITERKQAEEDLRLSEERFNKGFNADPNALIITRKADGLIQVVNDSFEKLFGYPRAEVIGRTTFELNLFAHPTDRDKAMEQLRTAPSLRAFEGDFRTKTGAIRQASVSVETITIDGEEHLLAIVEDISERKQAEESLRVSEAAIRQLNQTLLQRNEELETERSRWKGVVEGIADEVWVCDVRGNMSMMNLAAVTAMRLEEFQDWPVEQVLAEVEILYANGQLRPADQSPLLLSLKGKTVHGEEIMRHRRTGVIRHRQYSSAPTRDAAGRITGAVAIVRDITQNKQMEAALRLSEEKYRALFTSVMEGFTLNQAIYDEHGELVDLLVLEANPAAEVANGLQREEFVGKTWRELWPGAEQYWWEICTPVIRDKKQVTYENFAAIHDRWYEVHHFSAGENLLGSLFLDITERKRAEKALRESEERERTRANEMETLMDAAPVMIWISRDPECREMIGNRAGYEFLRMHSHENISKSASEAALANQHYQNMKDGRPIPAEELPMQIAAATGKPARDYSFDLVFDDGTTYNLIGNVNPLFAPNGKPAGAIGAFVDITELRKLQAKQLEDRTQLEIHHRLMDQREKDRQAIARDIHDGPVQTLSSTLFNIQFAKGIFTDPQLRVEMEQIELNVKNAVQELRQVIYELRPPSVIRFGLAKAIRFHAEDMREKYPELKLVLQLAEDGNQLSELFCLTLFRIYQEAITNVIRHAEASKAWVRFNLKKHELVLEIRDNGKGFPNQENIGNLTENGHYGLAGIKERVEAIGGELTISSDPGAGTSIKVSVPMPKG